METSMENILKKCHYIPMATMKKVIQLMETQDRSDHIDIFCKRNLLKLQQHRTHRKFHERDLKNYRYYDKDWKTVHRVACCKAIYSHDWDKLLYLLKKCPPWEHSFKDMSESSLYIRALLLLLMYHKSSQAQGLLNEYLHLVWSCRSVEDKKAVLKILLSLPEKIHYMGHTQQRTADKDI